MNEYSDECILTFLKNQGQLFSEPVAETMEEAEAFLEEASFEREGGASGDETVFSAGASMVLEIAVELLEATALSLLSCDSLVRDLGCGECSDN